MNVINDVEILNLFLDFQATEKWLEIKVCLDNLNQGSERDQISIFMIEKGAEYLDEMVIRIALHHKDSPIKINYGDEIMNIFCEEYFKVFNPYWKEKSKTMKIGV